MTNKNNYPLVSIICVNYNTAKVTIETIISLRAISYPNIEVIIVDNGSRENSDTILEQCPEIKLIKLSENLGFAGGNNVGIQNSNGEYILLLNSDTEVERNFLEPLVHLMLSDKSIGAVSPKLVYYFSENKNVIQYAGGNKINMFTGRNTINGKQQIDDGSYDFIAETDLAHGAAMLVPRKVIQEVGLMPEIYFLYYEEIDWAEMIKRHGYKIYYNGQSKVYHKESMSVGKENPMKTYYLNRNRLVFMRRNSSFYTYFIVFLFYTFISIPKNIGVFIFKGKYLMAKKLLQGYFWNLKNRNVKINPYLTVDKQIIYSKVKPAN